MWTLACEGSDGVQVVQAFEEIEVAVQRAVRHAQAEHGRPTLVGLSLKGESTMAIVVGGEWSYAMFQYEPSGPHFFSYRRESAGQKGDGPFIFMQFGSQGEADLEVTISPVEAWEGLRQYFVTGKLPMTIPWAGYSDGEIRYVADTMP